MSKDKKKDTPSHCNNKNDDGTAPSTILDLVASFVGPNNNSLNKDNGDREGGPQAERQREAHNVTSYLSRSQEAPRKAAKIAKIVIFTKDRPWQLEQLFQSMQLQRAIPSDAILSKLQFVVIANVSNDNNDFGFHCKQVQNRLEQTMSSLSEKVSLEFVLEDQGSCTFESCMRKVVKKDSNSNTRENELYWMFLTDDCVLLVSLWDLLETAVQALTTQEQPCDSVFLSRLHPGISWCQTKNQPAPAPSRLFRHLPTSNNNNDGVLLYSLDLARKSSRDGGQEWSYPWDLSGGVYHNSLIQHVFRQLTENSSTEHYLEHPNRLEIGGNQVLCGSSKTNSNISCIIPTRPLLLVLTINRVQTVFETPLACQDDQEYNPETLLNFLRSKQSLDLERYQSALFDSSHVGTVWLRGNHNDNSLPATTLHKQDSTALSVLIPVRSGPTLAAAHAMASIIMQPIEEWEHASSSDERDPLLLLSPLQIVLVDDGCHDGSINAMVDAARELTKEHDALVCLSTTDHRKRSAAAIISSNSQGQGVFVRIHVDVHSSPCLGISAALNFGLKQCRSELVARMDADDISCSGRLLTQKKALQSQPHLSVLGTNTLVFRPSTSGGTPHPIAVALPSDHVPYSHEVLPLSDGPLSMDSTSISVRPSVYPTCPGFAAWSMLFSCCLAHPSVVFRKSAVERVGGYDESLTSAEDYELWLRLIQTDCRSVGSIPMIGLWHRKRTSSTVRNTNVSKQATEALQACATGIKAIMKSDQANDRVPMMSRNVVGALRRPEDASKLQELDDAAELLMELETAFLNRYKTSLTAHEKELIRQDCSVRVGEIATLTVSKFGTKSAESSQAWKAWVERCPQHTLERIALLCQRG